MRRDRLIATDHQQTRVKTLAFLLLSRQIRSWVYFYISTLG